MTELADWADYIYRAEDLATLSGKAYNKKRNHVNRFMTDNPEWVLEPLKGKALDDAREFFAGMDSGSYSLMAEYERKQCATSCATTPSIPLKARCCAETAARLWRSRLPNHRRHTHSAYREDEPRRIRRGRKHQQAVRRRMLMRYPI